MAESAFEYLRSHELCFLATSAKDGRPHAAPMFYAADGAKIYFSAPDDSETAKNLKENPVAALAVADDPAEWSQARGLQIEGRVTELDGEEETAAAQAFGARYPHLGDAVNHTHYWRLDAGAAHYVHNEEAGDERFESLGQTWERETVAL